MSGSISIVRTAVGAAVFSGGVLIRGERRFAVTFLGLSRLKCSNRILVPATVTRENRKNSARNNGPKKTERIISFIYDIILNAIRRGILRDFPKKECFLRKMRLYGDRIADLMI